MDFRIGGMRTNTITNNGTCTTNLSLTDSGIPLTTSTALTGISYTGGSSAMYMAASNIVTN